MSESIYTEEERAEQRRAAARGYTAKYNATHREKNSRDNKRWREANRDKIIAYQEKTIERRMERGKKWKKANPAKYAIWDNARKKSMRRAKPHWYETDLVGELYRKRNELNERFDLTGDDAFVVDHIIPLNSKTVCGLHCWDNLQLLSRGDNRNKGNKYEVEW